MGMVAPVQRIASAFVVVCGRHGAVTRQAQERGEEFLAYPALAQVSRDAGTGMQKGLATVNASANRPARRRFRISWITFTRYGRAAERYGSPKCAPSGP